MPNALEVDVTGWVIARLTATLTGARVGSDTPADLATELPFVRVVRTGGPDDGYVLDVPTIVFHCFAATEQAANQLAYRLRGALARLVGVVADGATMTRCRKLGGPFWAAYENPDVRHAVLTMQLRIKTA